VKTALVFGVTGQDGSYLTEFLLEKNYKVYGVARRVSTGATNHERIAHIVDENFVLVEGDVTDPHSVNAVISLANPDEVYNLAAQSQVRTSFDQPAYTWNTTAGGVLNILEGIRQIAPEARFYQAGSSEMFGSSLGTPKGMRFPDGIVPNAHYRQDESTPFNPCSPYGVAKLAGHHLTKIYRDGYKLFACNGILFNHESPRRCDTFFSRKVCKYIAKLFVHARRRADLKLWTRDRYEQFLTDVPRIKLGNLSAYRDWGWASDFVRAMWLMLQQDKPDDYVIATGEAHTVKEFLVAAFQEGLGYYSDRFVQTDPALYRAVEVNYLCGDYSKANRLLGWEPQIGFRDIVRNMVSADIIEESKKAGLYETEYEHLTVGEQKNDE
jgi:GDPmannose 4,6-dehydratase